MSETTEAPNPRPRTCVITHVLPAAVIEMLREAPLNPTARAHVLAHTNRPIPTELATFEQIVEWIETNIRPQPTLDTRRAQLPNPTPQQPPQFDPFYPISVGVDYSDTETGQTYYRVRRYGTRRIPVSAAVLQNVIDRAEGFNEAVAEIRNLVEIEAEGEWPEPMEWGDDGADYYDSHGVQTRIDTEVEASEAQIQDRLMRWMQTSQPARLLELQEADGEETNDPD